MYHITKPLAVLYLIENQTLIGREVVEDGEEQSARWGSFIILDLSQWYAIDGIIIGIGGPGQRCEDFYSMLPDDLEIHSLRFRW